MINIIVAIAKNRAIGYQNQLLWHISEDLKFFKATTMGCPVIMGRKTFESLGRPLPGRQNIVVSRGNGVTGRQGDGAHGALAQQVDWVGSLEEAVEVAKGDNVFIIGGGQIYAQAMDTADRLYITEVDIIPENADTFFPEVDAQKWVEVSCSPTARDEKSGLEYRFKTYELNICKEKILEADSAC